MDANAKLISAKQALIEATMRLTPLELYNTYAPNSS